MEKGSIIEFKCSRVIVGNPVKAVLLSEDEEWINVRLLKDVEGLNTQWFSGETKSFRKCLIIGKIKKVLSPVNN